jgi:hypothetical protein
VESVAKSCAADVRCLCQRAPVPVAHLYQRPASVHEGPSSGFSLIMHRLVSMLMRTVESKGICVRACLGGGENTGGGWVGSGSAQQVAQYEGACAAGI